MIGEVRVAEPASDLQAELEALRASEESYRTIFQLATDAMFLHDPDTGAIVEANQQACQLLGCSRDDLRTNGLARLRQHPATLPSETAGANSASEPCSNLAGAGDAGYATA